MKTNKFFAILLAMLIMCSTNIVSFASENDNGESINTATINSLGLLETDSNNPNDIDLIYCDSINDNNIDIIEEYIDNGSDVYIDMDNIEECADIFDCSYSINDDNSKSEVLGCYIQTVDNQYSLTPVTVLMIDDDSNLIDISDEHLNQINNDIDSTELYENLKYSYTDVDFSGKVTEEELSHLQISNNFGSSFKDVSFFRYFLKKGTTWVGTTYEWSTTSKSNYKRLGSINILGYGFKIKTDGTTTYDNIYSVVTASGLDNTFVKYYTYNMSTSSPGNIIYAPILQGDINKSVTVGIATGISSDGKVTNTNTTSYSYNPNGQHIVNQHGEKLVKTWKAAPASQIKNNSWQLKPYITVKTAKGTTQTATVKMYVSEFQVSGGTRTYTISTPASVSFSFKNHK